MRDSFIQFSVNTIEEILEASYVYPNGKGDELTENCTIMNYTVCGKGKGAGTLDSSKLVSKMKQFFPNIVLSAEEVSQVD